MRAKLDEVVDQAGALADAVEALHRRVYEDTQAGSTQHLSFALDTASGLGDKLRDLRRAVEELQGTDIAASTEESDVINATVYLSSARALMIRLQGALALITREATKALYQQDFLRTVSARESDSLQTLAAREMGDWARWRDLVAANVGEVGPDDLPHGTPLVVPR